MDEPVRLRRKDCDAMHLDQLRQHGGIPGVRDENALESALARPRNKWSYEPTIGCAALAAAYGFGLATNHGYNDGNKRIAFIAMYTFLGINGWDLETSEPEVVQVMVALADGRIDEVELTSWIRDRLVESPL